MDDRIRFKLDFHNGRLRARCIENSALEAEGLDVRELKRKVQAAVQLIYGAERGFRLLVG